ncbi:MAG: hypothetical protein QOD75_984 [Blastocatellia bacterium]|jgi:hypothetical protein|nr:hypothetical protein [Blastocatellia bacterium]
MKLIRAGLLSNTNPGIKTLLAPPHLLVAAAIFHVAVTVTIFAIGRNSVLPGTFDPSGIAGTFASDALEFRAEAGALSELLRQGLFSEWVKAPFAFHVKLYSISFALLGPWLDFTILAAEPLNLLCYLAILVLVYQLGREAFDPRAGMVAAAIVGLWPSLLIHTTQVLKDPLFIVGMLAFVLVNMRLLRPALSWRAALLLGAIGGWLAIPIWLTRDNLGELMIATALLGAAMLIAQQLWERRFRTPSLAGMALLLLLTIGTTRVVPSFKSPYPERTDWQTGQSLPKAVGDGSLRVETNPTTTLAAKVDTVRRRFLLMYPESTSNVDSHVRFSTTADLIRYLPRAAAIGFFAPFPNMWFSGGKQIGSAGRLLSGIETLAIYALETLALLGLWHGRRRFSVWLLAAIAAANLTILGLAVINVGALYRLRYAFLILMIIIAGKGVPLLFDRFIKPAHV